MIMWLKVFKVQGTQEVEFYEVITLKVVGVEHSVQTKVVDKRAFPEMLIIDVETETLNLCLGNRNLEYLIQT